MAPDEERLRRGPFLSYLISASARATHLPVPPSRYTPFHPPTSLPLRMTALDVFQELSVAHPLGPAAARAVILGALDDLWIHRPDAELDASLDPLQSVLSLERPTTDKLPGVTLWMYSDKSGRLSVSNIVPITPGELGLAGYNAALNHFLQAVIQPACETSPLTVSITPSTLSIQDWAGASAAKALTSFSNLANKSTGRGHPRDEERWLAFLLEAHKSDSALTSEQLSRWLIEVARWPVDTAHQLASEYALSRSLLSLHDKRY